MNKKPTKKEVYTEWALKHYGEIFFVSKEQYLDFIE